MKRLLLLAIPVLALLILAAPVAASDKPENSPEEQITSEVEHGKSADAHANVENRRTESENQEADSENENVSDDKGQNGANRLQFYTVTGASSDNVTDTEVDGTVNVVAPGGDIALVIEGNIKSGLVADGDEDAGKDFEVWVRNLTGYTGTAEKTSSSNGYFLLDTLTVNEQGHGQFHINIPAEYLPAGTYEIQVAINFKDGGTVIATAWPGLTVEVGSED